MTYAGIHFSSLEGSRDAATAVADSVVRGQGITVVTPNLQHLALVRSEPAFLAAINDADIIVPDGWPIAAWLRRHYGYRGGRIAGSDLAPAILEGLSARDRATSVTMIGGTDVVLAAALERMALNYPRLRVIAPGGNPDVHRSPSSQDFTDVLEAIPDDCDVVFLCMGAPKSELLARELRMYRPTLTILCFGAVVDFMAGSVRRAPRWVQRARLEWLFRLIREPRRLSRRYAEGFVALCAASWREGLRRDRTA